MAVSVYNPQTKIRAANNSLNLLMYNKTTIQKLFAKISVFVTPAVCIEYLSIGFASALSPAGR